MLTHDRRAAGRSNGAVVEQDVARLVDPIVVACGATIATSVPVIWHFLGHQFKTAGMIAALFSCLSARLWIGAARSVKAEHRRSFNIPVTGMVLAVSAGLVISQRPERLRGPRPGAGRDVLGESIFNFAEHYPRKAGAVFGLDDPPDRLGATRTSPKGG